MFHHTQHNTTVLRRLQGTWNMLLLNESPRAHLFIRFCPLARPRKKESIIFLTQLVRSRRMCRFSRRSFHTLDASSRNFGISHREKTELRWIVCTSSTDYWVVASTSVPCSIGVAWHGGRSTHGVNTPYTTARNTETPTCFCLS